MGVVVSMEEFQEIAHTGGKIEFVYSEERNGVRIKVSNANGGLSTVVQLLSLIHISEPTRPY